MQITIIGAGAFGQALAKILAFNHHAIIFYDPILYPEISLNNALKNSTATIFVAPAKTFAATASSLPPDRQLILASKGFTSMRLFERFSDFAALGGAGFAKDIERHFSDPISPEPITLTCSDQKTADLFRAEPRQILTEILPDPKSIIFAGALKNIFALIAGFYSTYDNLTTENLRNHILAEFEKNLKFNRLYPATFNSSCGQADLLLCLNPDSRNFAFGQQLGSTLKTISGPNAKNPPNFSAVNLSVLKSTLASTTIESVTLFGTVSANTAPDLTISPDSQLFWKFHQLLAPLLAQLFKAS